MAFLEELQQYDNFDFASFFESVTEDDVLRVLTKDRLSREDFMVLLSPAGGRQLEAIAQKAEQVRIQHFGYGMQLFTPMYIANYCENHCVYCGFKHTNKIDRKQLSLEEIRKEGEAIAKTGLEHVLVLTGESQTFSNVDYILSAVKVLQEIFASVSIEIYALSNENYKRCADAGVDGMTMFQEVYDPTIYKQLHLAGPKSIFDYRLDAPERAARAGIRCVTLGALLGLDMWRKEAFFTGMHADYLQHKYQGTEIAISVPRLRPCVGGFPPRDVVTDRDIVQYICAYRLFMPRAGITVSSRESATMRDHLVHLGVTKMSAGVTTAVGGHTSGEDAAQFDINDSRSVDEMSQMLYREGYQPIYKDWQVL